MTDETFSTPPINLSYEELYHQVCKENEELIKKYRSIQLANENMSRNDHVHFGDLLLERNSLRESLKLAVEALEEIEDLKITCKKLIADKPDRNWVIEDDVNRWRSFEKIELALENIKAKGEL
jgi:hypothetical protein